MLPENNHLMYLVNFGKLIKAAIEKTGMKEDTLAHAIGVHQSTISKIIKGKCSSLSIVRIIRIGAHLQIPWADLLPP